MQKKREISEYRERLDKTLASPELINGETLKTLIRNQLCSSSIHGNQECNDEILDQRTADVSSILKKLRSVSMKDHEFSKSSNEEASYGDWKVKHDHEDCRVMYREGLEGNPFHTLLVEGYVDGPVEDCLCVSWESSLYEKWWPKTAFPTFKVLETKCLQKFRIDEQICSVRMKVPWPLTDREAVVHYFLFEYFKDGLVIILLNSISDAENMEVESNKNGLPEAMNAVRIDLVGGCAIQKVTPERSYFRTIADLDIKLDMFPPSLINFMSRQLMGNGFRLYKKSVASVAKFDEDYTRALADPLYTRIRRALYSTDKTDEIREENDVVGSRKECIVLPKEHIQVTETQSVPSSCENVPVLEIEEEESVSSDENVTKKGEINCERQFCISPEVEQALGTLEKVISMVRRSRTDTRIEEEENTLTSSDEESSSPNHLTFLIEKSEIVSSSKADPKIEVLDHNINNRRAGSNSFAREGNKIAPGSPEQDLTTSEVTRITISQATTLFRQTAETDNCNSKMEIEVEEKHGNLSNGKNLNLQRKDRKPRCLAFRSCF